jgi:hypothetical protein
MDTELYATLQTIRGYLDRKDQEHTRAIQTFATLIWAQHVKPLLIERKWSMVSGNGDYWLRSEAGTPIDHDALPENLRAIMDVYVDRQSSLAEWMPDFDYQEYLRQEKV